jgi:cephalosporin-C deacetylase-like acetyl esterase
MKVVLSLTLGMALAASAIAESLPKWTPADVPGTIDDLWKGYDPDKEDLEVNVLQEWDKGSVILRLITYKVGTFKGKTSQLSAYYAFPKKFDGKIPGVLHMHGGGQRASADVSMATAENGYAAISINWGGRRLAEVPEGALGTDWGALNATQTHNSHYAKCTPDEWTLDSFESPRNNNWFLIVLAARRAISFLQQQDIVDGSKIGVHGHSMGGKLTTMVAGVDKRVKAAVPSCGGSGSAPKALRARKGNAARPQIPTRMYADCIDDATHAKRITCPIIYKGPQNDFNGLIDNLFMNWEGMPSKRVGYAIAKHLNHRSDPATSFIDYLWFEEHLKGTVKLPLTPQIAVDLTGASGEPLITVRPDRPGEVKRVDIFYSQDPNGQFRYYRTAKSAKTGDAWTATAPIQSDNMGFFAIANVYYDFPLPDLVGPRWNRTPPEQYLLSSRLVTFEIPAVRAAKPEVADKAERLLEADFNDLQDWYVLNRGNHMHCFYSTRKPKDPKWRGPKGALLAIDVKDARGGDLVMTFEFNSYGQYGRDRVSGNYYAIKPIETKAGWQTITISIDDLKGMKGETNRPNDWETLCELGVRGHVKVNGKVIGSGKFDDKRQLRKLRWVGGEYPRSILMPGGGVELGAADYARQFQSQIDVSIELEKTVDGRE